VGKPQFPASSRPAITGVAKPARRNRTSAA